LVLLFAFMCPISMEMSISSFFFCTSGQETVQELRPVRRLQRRFA